MRPRTSISQWILGLVVIATGAAISIPLARYSEADDAPGGVVIAAVIFFGAVGIAIRIVKGRRDPESRAH